MSNPDVALTLRDCVDEVLNTLTGLDLVYDPNMDRFRSITRMLNRALRANATEAEWSYYSSVEQVGYAYEGQQTVPLRSTIRPRIINDDAVRLVDRDNRVHAWAYFLPRDALHKYRSRAGLWVAHTRSTLEFSRPFIYPENGLMIEVPVMREPKMFDLPPLPENPDEAITPVPDDILEQELDFDYPDLVVARAACLYAQTDPLMQPRVQTLDAAYKDLMYQFIERDERNTDSPYVNEFILPIDGDSYGPTHYHSHHHPHSDIGRYH